MKRPALTARVFLQNLTLSELREFVEFVTKAGWPDGAQVYVLDESSDYISLDGARLEIDTAGED